jgi:hypothetical protein
MISLTICSFAPSINGLYGLVQVCSLVIGYIRQEAMFRQVWWPKFVYHQIFIAIKLPAISISCIILTSHLSNITLNI